MAKKKDKPTVVKDLKDIPGGTKADKPKPQELPGVTGPGVSRIVIPRIEKQAEKVTGHCARRKEITELERQDRELLLAMLDEEKLKNYRLEDGRIVYVDDKRKAKIKSSDEPDED
jgi:hypothetical protein